MKRSIRHNNSSALPRRRKLYLVSFMGVALCLWFQLPLPASDPDLLLPSLAELKAILPSMVFTPNELPNFTPDEWAKAKLGRRLFFDRRFSANGQIACSSCHDPNKNFSDGLRVPKALGEGVRRTPSLVNSFASHWFFWDGRADSLAAQALGPIEHPGEHGISRVHLVRLVYEHYRADYEQLFGAWPKALENFSSAKFPSEAMPQKASALLTPRIAAYTLASLTSFLLQNELMSEASRLSLSPQALVAQRSDFRPFAPAAWAEAWEGLGPEAQEAVNQVAAHFGEALAAYERGIVAVDSPFDRFAQRLLAEDKLSEGGKPILGDGFGNKELRGLQLFVGPGQCISCHTGANFSDQQFHNIGLPLAANANAAYIDVGRALGVHLIKQDAFNCLGPYFLKEEAAQDKILRLESCQELPWLDAENLELVGAFKTPSLRNVELRAPYGHHGELESLAAVLNHYNSFPQEGGLGHLEETLKPLNLAEADLEALEVFLRSLTSLVRDLSAEG